REVVGPLLRERTVAVVELHLRTVGRRGTGLQAAPGLRVAQRAVGRGGPHLVPGARAVLQLDERAVRRAVAGDVQAAAGLRVPHAAVGLGLPDLVPQAVAVPEPDAGAVGVRGVRDVHATATRAGHRAGDSGRTQRYRAGAVERRDAAALDRVAAHGRG